MVVPACETIVDPEHGHQTEMTNMSNTAEKRLYAASPKDRLPVLPFTIKIKGLAYMLHK
jgi:hypothetical protein